MNKDEATKLVMTMNTYSSSLRKQIITGDLNLQEGLSKAEMLMLAEKEIKFMSETSLNQKEESSNEIETNPVKRSKSTVSRNCGGNFQHQRVCPAKSARMLQLWQKRTLHKSMHG